MFIQKATYMNDSLEYGLGYSINNSYITPLFTGAVYDSYQIQVYVQIYDNDTAFTIYYIPSSIVVQPDVSNLQIIEEKLILEDSTFIDNLILNQGDYLNSIQLVQSLSSLLNGQSLSDKLGLILKDSSFCFPDIYGPLENYMGVKPVW